MPTPSPLSPPDGLTDLVRLHRRVRLAGPTGSGLTARLVAHHRGLIDSGVRPESILALDSPDDLERWRRTAPGQSAIAALSFEAWVRRELEAFWPVIEASGGLPPAGPAVGQGRPVGFASAPVARYRMARETAALREAGTWDGRLRARPSAQVAQLLATLAFSIDHMVPFEEAAERLAAAWVGSEGVRRCRREVAEALKLYRDWSLTHRVLDAALQRDVYFRCLWPDPVYRQALADRARHLLVDAWSVTTPLAQRVLGPLLEAAETAVVATADDQIFAEAEGADPAGAIRLTEGWHAVSLAPTSPAPLVAFGTALTEAASGRVAAPVDPEDRLALRLGFSTRPAMLQAALQDLRGLLAAGTAPEAIALVLPRPDRFATSWLQAELRRHAIPYRLLIPARPLAETLGVQVLCTLAGRLYGGDWKGATEQQLQAVAETLLGLDPLTALPVAQALATGRPGESAGLEPWPDSGQAAWTRLKGVLERYRTTGPWPVDQALRVLLLELWAPAQGEAEAGAIAQLVDLAVDFLASAAGPEGLSTEAAGLAFLAWVRQGDAYEAPAESPGVLLASGYTYARSGPPVDFQLWLDLTSQHWRWPLRRELFDPTVLSAGWSGEIDNPEIDERDAELRLARAWRSMLLRARKAVRGYASDLDEEGREQSGAALWEPLLGSAYAGLEASP